MSNLSPIIEIQKDFEVEFERCALDYERVAFDSATAHCFFATIPSEKALKDTWIQISNFVAVKFQNKLDNEYEKWNIYLFYRIENQISRDLHYLIENDTFSSRKIIIDVNKSKDDIIREHILNKDMTVDTVYIQGDSPFIYNTIIRESLENIKVKKRLGLEIENSLEEIILKIKNNSL